MRDCDAKGTIPCSPPAHTVPPPLVHWLLQAARRRLVVLTAPAGAGKTALLATFAHHAPLPLVWYSLDRRDREGRTFVEGLVRACRQSLPTSVAPTTALLATTPRPSLPALRAALLHDLARVPHDVILVLDNWHHVATVPASMRIVEEVLAHCPHWHLILAARRVPALRPMLRLAANRQLCGIDADGLRTGFAPSHGDERTARRDLPASVGSTRRSGIQHQQPIGVDVAA